MKMAKRRKKKVLLAMEARNMWDVAQSKAESDIRYDNLTLSDIHFRLNNVNRFEYIRNLLGYKLDDIYSWPILADEELKKETENDS